MTTTTVAVATMKSAQVPAPGAEFQIIEREIPDPAPGQVRIKVQACGVCHSDVFTKEGWWPGIQYPRAPGRKTLSWLFAVVVAGPVSLLLAPSIMAQTAADSTSLHWQVPDVLPPGALIAIVKGDPAAAGESTLQLSMPNGYRIPPHSHPSYEHVEVREGTLLVGMGDRLDPKQTHTLVAGDSATAPAGMHHFSIAKGRTVLSVTFMGPYTITYVRAEDAPRPRVFPFSY